MRRKAKHQNRICLIILHLPRSYSLPFFPYTYHKQTLWDKNEKNM
ncbi:hypothetical protein B4070_3406 [Bacillus subtilis]|nr:hypothetical protein B4070_3406 [Bacillus subtilis]